MTVGFFRCLSLSSFVYSVVKYIPITFLVPLKHENKAKQARPNHPKKVYRNFPARIRYH